MFVRLKATDSHNQIREFSCWPDSLETAFDFLSNVALSHDKILQVDLIDNAHCVQLPTEAFDGAPFSMAIQQLEREWQQILHQPLSQRGRHTHWFIDKIHQQLKTHQAHIDRLKLAMEITKQNCQQAQERIFWEPSRSRLLEKYERFLNQYENQLALALIREQTLANQLAQLQLIG